MIYFRGMKQILLSISIIFATALAYGQDQVILTAGDTIDCKIYWVAQGQISIQFAGDQREVALEVVDSYVWNGKTYDQKKVSKLDPLLSVRPSDKYLHPAIGHDFNAAGTSLIVGGILSLVGGVLSGIGGVILVNDRPLGTGLIIGGSVAATVGIVLDFHGFNKIRLAGKKLQNPELIKPRYSGQYDYNQ
jgi:hypothetical protein